MNQSIQILNNQSTTLPNTSSEKHKKNSEQKIPS